MMHGFSGSTWDWTTWLTLGLAIVFVVAVAVAVVFFMRARHEPASAGSGGASRPPSQESAREILRRRYAASEIDREEYQQKLKDL